MILIIILICILIIISRIENHVKEGFAVYWSGANIPEILPIRQINGSYTNLPWNNMRMGQTSNMSYDLRGDPFVIPKYPFQFNYSTLTPIYNRPI